MLSALQLRWLYAHGGREEKDVLMSNKNKPYVLMGTVGKGCETIFIPDDEEITKYFNDSE